MTLIIRDQLVNPPTWFASFRDLTLYCHIFLRDDVVIESDDIDTYYRWIKPRGGMDFIEDFVRPGAEDGLHLDTEYNYPPHRRDRPDRPGKRPPPDPPHPRLARRGLDGGAGRV